MPQVDEVWLGKIVELVRRTRSHPDLRVGSSVRGAMDATAVVASLAALREQPITTPSVGLDAILVALSGRVRLREGCAAHVGGDHHRAVGRGLRHHPTRRRRGEHGKSEGPDGGFPGLKEGQQALDAIDRARQSTTSRRELARHERFEDVSPDVGELDEAAFDELMAEDADEAMAMLADMTRATDVRLRELARRLAGRLLLDVARRGPARPRGVGKIRSAPVRARRRRPRHRREHGGDRRGPCRRLGDRPRAPARSAAGSSRAPRCACSSTAAGRWAGGRSPPAP